MPTSKNINWKVKSITLDRNNPFSHPFISADLYTSVFPKTWSPNELAMDLQDHLNKKSVLEPENVIFNPPATIVLWADNTKTVVKCQEGDTYDPEHGLAMAIVKKMYGNTGKYCEIFKKWIKEEENDPPEIPSISFEEALEIMKKQAIEGLSWTLTKEKLPSESGDYLVYDLFTGSSYVYEYDKTSVNDVIYFQRNVSHWMPVPAAPVTKKGE